MNNEEKEEVAHVLADAIPELCAELLGRSDEVEPADVMRVLAGHGLELRMAAPFYGE